MPEQMLPSYVVNLCYLASAVLFIMGLKGLTHPRTAVRGNTLGAFGMFIAVAVTLIANKILSAPMIWAGLAVGSVVGLVLAVKIQMTAMPQMVAAFNGFGGAASALVAGYAIIEHGGEGGLFDAAGDNAFPHYAFLVAVVLSILIGAVTFSGSFVAFAKLQELMKKDMRFAGQSAVNAVVALACIGIGVWLVQAPDVSGALLPFWVLMAVAMLLGVFLTVPIGGADMPVVISLLNSYSGLAACATGFVIENNVLIIAGSLVGASGLILTKIMCVAMNRSLVNVLFGTLEPAEAGPDADSVYAGRVKSTSPDEVAMLFDTARRVCIVPGYGMAVAQCQHNVREFSQLLESRGVEVEFAIHPVAGRMPGHMNVLLAEADIEYEKLKEMDDANSDMGQVDVCIVLGANDVVNPVAREANSAIAGMPIIDVDKARTVVVIKRSLSPGFAGIPNPLFAADNTLMLFGDGKKAMVELVSAVKEAA